MHSLLFYLLQICFYQDDKINIDYEGIGENKFFYDVIYNPINTKFLLKGKELGNKTENGKAMFVYQAPLSFEIWHKIKPKINSKVFEILNNG